MGKDRRKALSSNTGESSQGISVSPSTTAAATTDIGDGRRASDTSTNLVSRPGQLERLTSAPNTLGPGSSFRVAERSPSRSAKRREDPLGLTVVYEPETSPPLDIIFVNGLGGTSRATWAKERDPEYCWPEKWLPFEPGIQSARILSFGYNANFAATGPAPITGIADFARDLLYSMKFAKDENLEELELGQVGLLSSKLEEIKLTT